MKLFETKISLNPELINPGIYCITCVETEKKYVGSTIRSFICRLKQHKRELKNNTHHCIHLQNAFNKYGKEAFIFEILEIHIDKNTILQREQYYIDSLKPEFNCCPKAGNNLGLKMQPRKEEHTLKVIQSSRNTIRENNKTGYTGIYYSEKEKDYRPSLQVGGIRVSLGSYKTLEEAILIRKQAEEYFWQPYIEELPKHLKELVVKQYKEACKVVRSNTNVEGVSYSELKQHSAFITTKDNVAINLGNYLTLKEAIKLRKDAEQYFYSEDFIDLSSEQKEEAINNYKDKLKASKITSGHQFIIWDKSYSSWIVKPNIDNKLLHLGSYKDLHKAIEVKQKAMQYFTSNEFLSNDLETRLELAQQYKTVCHEQNSLIRATGVSFHTKSQSWRAYIYVNGKNISLGQYPTKDMALQARKDGELKYK